LKKSAQKTLDDFGSVPVAAPRVQSRYGAAAPALTAAIGNRENGFGSIFITSGGAGLAQLTPARSARAAATRNISCDTEVGREPIVRS
jgi:hypothetical protein